MNDHSGYAVFFFPQALEALGDAIKPYLTGQENGPHIICKEIDTGGAFTEMSLVGQDAQGRAVELEVMVPSSMIRLIVSAQADGNFGFGPRVAVKPIASVEAAPAAADVALTPAPQA